MFQMAGQTSPQWAWLLASEETVVNTNVASFYFTHLTLNLSFTILAQWTSLGCCGKVPRKFAVARGVPARAFFCSHLRAVRRAISSSITSCDAHVEKMRHHVEWDPATLMSKKCAITWSGIRRADIPQTKLMGYLPTTVSNA